MPRQARKESGTGIFHVMMRGINHQNIFEDEEDNYQFINTLDRMRVKYDDEGNPCGSNCCYYAYCLMGNHFHLLIRERDERVGETIKRIASSYVYYYNRKYGRDGHLFKERFKSEPVNDMAYFTVLLRYIHQNPVKAGIVEKVKDYEFSSWGEYDGTVEPVFQICDVNTVLNRITFKELDEWVNDPLDDDVYCLDIEGSSRRRPSDDQVWLKIKDKTGVTNSTSFQQLDENKRNEMFLELKDCGASLRQLERLTGIGKGVIHRIWCAGPLLSPVPSVPRE